VPPRTGRPLRTVLRLEAVEDRTLASTTAVEPPKFLTSTHLGTTSKPATPAPATDKPQTNSDDSDQTATPTPTFSAADGTPVLLTGGLSLTTAVELPLPTAREQATLDVRSSAEPDTAGESNLPAKPGGTRSDPSVGTESGSASTGVTPSQSPAATPAAPPGRSPSDVSAAATQVTGQPVRRTDFATGTNGRPVNVAGDATGPRASRASNSAATVTSGSPANPSLPADLSDGALLQRFVANKEDAAFTALVRRYASTVLGVCQRVLGDFHAAQDASQATFVILARKAGMLDRTTPLGGWLYKVAYHLALRSRGVAAKHRLTERTAADEATVAAEDTVDLEQGEVNQIVREELQGLPEKYRAPLALVYIDGRSHADAAQAIGLPRGSMAKRVGEGLDRLRERLVHRGISL
jgi:RNA polymerase sigma factor (sigma-70 family)